MLEILFPAKVLEIGIVDPAFAHLLIRQVEHVLEDVQTHHHSGRNRYANKRAEMWGRMNGWLRDEAGVDIVDSDEWQASLCAPGYSFDSNSRLKLEPKEKIRERVGFSPDVGDALALTFAEVVRSKASLEMARYMPAQTESEYEILKW